MLQWSYAGASFTDLCSLQSNEVRTEVTSICELFMLFVCGQSQTGVPMIFPSVFTLHYSRVYQPERRTRHLS